jgi:hypothetical protein
VKVPDSAVQITNDDAGLPLSLTIHLTDVPVVDAFTFPPPTQDVPGISPFQLIPATVSFDITYTNAGNRRTISPGSDDPLSPLNWAGKMSDATNHGTFSVKYNNNSFSESGSFDSVSSSGVNFGEMGTERNGFFVKHEQEDDNDDADAESGTRSLSLPLKPTQTAQLAASATPKQPQKVVLLKGRVPVKVAQ